MTLPVGHARLDTALVMLVLVIAAAFTVLILGVLVTWSDSARRAALLDRVFGGFAWGAVLVFVVGALWLAAMIGLGAPAPWAAWLGN